METKINYTLVGLFVLILTTVVVIISLWLSFGLDDTSYKTYLVYMDESVSGLSLQAPVKYNGVEVGYVSNIALNQKNPNEVILTLKIDTSTPINQTTEAVLMQQGLTGIAFVGLQGGANAKPLLTLPGQNYPIIHSSPSFFLRLDQAIQGLTNNVNGLSNNLQLLLDKDNLQNIHDTLLNLNQITTTLASNSQKFDQSMDSLNSFLKNASQVSQQLPNLISTIQDTANHFNTMSVNFNQAAVSTNGAVNAISDQLLPKTYELLQSANGVTSNLQSISSQLQQNPGALISGTTPPKPGPGE